MSSAAHAHKETKERQHRAHAASKKTKPGKLVLAPQVLLFKRVVLRTGVRGTVTGYAGSAARQLYLMTTQRGDRVEFAYADIIQFDN